MKPPKETFLPKLLGEK